MKITYYGHSCFGVHIGGKNILFDPFIRHNELAKHIRVEDIKADYIFLTHGHQDHVADALEIAERTGATLVSNYEVVVWFQEKGVKNTHPVNHGGKRKFDFGTARYVNAIHSSTMPDGSRGGNPGGFVIESNDGNLYNAGDTALTLDMQLIPLTCGKLDIALLPIGGNFTMDVDDAILASDFIKCNRIIGMHYDTFGYIKINHKEAIERFKAKGKELILMKIGETMDFKTNAQPHEYGYQEKNRN